MRPSSPATSSARSAVPSGLPSSTTSTSACRQRRAGAAQDVVDVLALVEGREHHEHAHRRSRLPAAWPPRSSQSYHRPVTAAPEPPVAPEPAATPEPDTELDPPMLPSRGAYLLAFAGGRRRRRARCRHRLRHHRRDAPTGCRDLRRRGGRRRRSARPASASSRCWCCGRWPSGSASPRPAAAGQAAKLRRRNASV